MPRPQRRWPLLIGALAAGVIIFGAIVIAGWNPFAITGPEASGSGSPSPGIAAFAANWAPAEVELPGHIPSEMTDVVFYRGRWVAVGARNGTDATISGGQIWISTDRRHWEAVADRAVFTPQTVTWSVAAGSAGLVAVGRDDVQARMWTSVDGRTWRAAPPQDSIADGIVLGVEYGPTGYVAVGYSVGDIGVTAVVWRSNDGLTWQATPPAEGFGSTSLMGIAFGQGREVAVGVTSHGNEPDVAGTSVPWAWSSSDGVNWLRAELPSDDHSQVLGVVALANGFLAFGYGAQGPQIWISDASNQWRLLGADALPGATRSAVVSSVITSTAGLLAIGTDFEGDNGWGRVWRSDDGTTWRQVAGREQLPGVGVHAAALGPNGLVAVGTAPDPALGYVAAAWYSR
jgi:hypothetical protein